MLRFAGQLETCSNYRNSQFAKPNCVLNLVTGPGAQLGNEIAWKEDVGVVCTGSFKAGYEFSSNLSQVRPIIAVGGKNPANTESADLYQAVQGISNAAFWVLGHQCMFKGVCAKNRQEGIS